MDIVITFLLALWYFSKRWHCGKIVQCWREAIAPCLAPVSAASARELGAIVQEHESHLAEIANRQQNRSSHSYPQLTGSHSFQGTQFSPSPCSSLMRLLFSSISGSLPGFGCGTHSLSRRLPKGLRSHLRISAQESFLNSPHSDMPSCEFSKHCLKNSHPGSPGSSPFGGAGQPGGVIASPGVLKGSPLLNVKRGKGGHRAAFL